MCRYLDNLLSDFGGSRNPVANRDQHLLFYTICQGLFYVLLFRHPDVIDTDGGSQFVNSLCLKRVIESSLNPLLVCSNCLSVDVPDPVFRFAISESLESSRQ